MKMTNKYILASGCSYTDETWQTNKQYPWKAWPELLAEKIDPKLNVKNLGSRSSNNDYIYQSLLTDIIHNHKDIELVVVSWTEFHRIEYFLGAAEKNRTGNTRMNLGWLLTDDGKKHNAKLHEDYYVDGFINVAKGFFAQPWAAQDMLASTINNIYNLQSVCKKFDIKLIQSQMLDPFQEYFLQNMEKQSWHKKSNFLNTFISQKNFYNIDAKKFIGWPIFEELGGYFLTEHIDETKRIGYKYNSKTFDHHLNEDGHKQVADIYYSKWKQEYEN